MITVIVVPETKEFKDDVFHGEIIYINGDHGEPKLKDRNTKYIAPYWLDNGKVERVYEISEVHFVNGTYEIYLGNSYVVDGGWNKMGQGRRFEYHDLASFGFDELKDGFLVPL